MESCTWLRLINKYGWMFVCTVECANTDAPSQGGSKKQSYDSPEARCSATRRRGSDRKLQQIDGLEQAINFTINETY